jgi:hypothetical protein
MKKHGNSTISETLKFLATLWVSQEILKLLPNNSPWKETSERVDLQQLGWNDEIALRAETAENSRLMLGHSRLMLSHIPAREPATKAAPRNSPTKTTQSKGKINFVHRLSQSSFKLSNPGRSIEKRKS